MQRKRVSLTVAMAIFTVLDQRGMTICSEDLREGTGLLEKEGFNLGERDLWHLPSRPQSTSTNLLAHTFSPAHVHLVWEKCRAILE